MADYYPANLAGFCSAVEHEEIAASGYSNVLRVHPFSTRSHAKFTICDEGESGTGWPLSSARATGSTAILRLSMPPYGYSDPEIVSDLLFQVAELSCGVERHWTDITDEFARLAVNARQQPSPGGARAIGTLVTGPGTRTFCSARRQQKLQAASLL